MSAMLCFLGESGVCFGVDRFDPGREITEKIGTLSVGARMAISHEPVDVFLTTF
jgi:hypothetical protein